MCLKLAPQLQFSVSVTAHESIYLKIQLPVKQASRLHYEIYNPEQVRSKFYRNSTYTFSRGFFFVYSFTFKRTCYRLYCSRLQIYYKQRCKYIVNICLFCHYINSLLDVESLLQILFQKEILVASEIAKPSERRYRAVFLYDLVCEEIKYVNFGRTIVSINSGYTCFNVGLSLNSYYITASIHVYD
ncbi:hypothetical protein BD770DRAFT_415272 [Pilaira anomala]|nr:hypothetical protein BD770DRAFT_415272 [Pilaira anomala]